MTLDSTAYWTLTGDERVPCEPQALEPMASVLVNVGEGPADQDWLRALRAKELETVQKENAELRAELQKFWAQLPEVKMLEEKLLKRERSEASWKARAEELASELELAEQRQEEAQGLALGLQEQVATLKGLEAELERLRRSEEELRLRDGRLLELSAEREEAKRQLVRSDKVCTELLQEMKDQKQCAEQLRQENKELQNATQSRSEELKRVAQEASELGKAKEVLEERLRSREQQLQAQDAEVQRLRREAEEARGDWEGRHTKAQEEVLSLQESVKEKVRLEYQLKEKLSILESQVQQHRAEESRLRQDVLRLQTLADERELVVEKVQKREDCSSEKASDLQQRLQEAQAALLSERGKLRDMELELRAARDAALSVRREMEDARYREESVRRDAARREEKVAEGLVAEREAELRRLDQELMQCRARLSRRDREVAQLTGELRTACSRENVLERALEQAAKHKIKAEVSWHQARRRLQEPGTRELASTDSPTRLRLGREARWHGSAPAPRSRSEPRVREESSASEYFERTWHPTQEPSVRLSDASEERTDFDRHIPTAVAEPHSPAPRAPSPAAPVAHGGLELWHRRVVKMEQRHLLLEVWHAWAATAKVFALRARLELVLLDELRLAKVREEAKADYQKQLLAELRGSKKWPEGTGPAEPDPPLEGFVESKLASLKSFIFEFRQRVAESVAELPGASQAAYGLEGSQALVKTLELGRGAFGRLLHASLFLYQKLRTLVPTELEVTMKDPLSKLVPVPFYVLPYKVPPKVRLAVQEIGSRRSLGGLARSLSRGTKLRQGQLEELQDLMPLCASDRTAVPGFLALLLRVRGEAAEAAVGHRDGLDQLVVDALTVYMSGWRLSRDAAPAPAPPQEPIASEAREARSAPRGRPLAPRAEMKLRLGPERTD